jgi:hypothetical protein
MSPVEPKRDATGKAPTEAGVPRHVVSLDPPNGLRALLDHFGEQLRQDLRGLNRAYQTNSVSSEVASVLHGAAARYRTLRSKVARLPMSNFNGSAALRHDALTALRLTERGLTGFAAASAGSEISGSGKIVQQAIRDLNEAQALGRRVSSALHLPHR